MFKPYSNGGLVNKLKPTKITLDSDVRMTTVNCLNKTLAIVSDLRSHAKQAHWAVKGSDYYQLHLLFDQLAGNLDAPIDEIAERISTLGGYVLGTNEESVKGSILECYCTSISNGIEHLDKLSNDYSIVSTHAREHIKLSQTNGDLGTADLYTRLSLLIDKDLWFLESHYNV